MTAPGPEELPQPKDRRIVRHIQALADAGNDVKKFVTALERVRDDFSLSTAQREAIFKTLAQDAAAAYFVFATGKPIDLEELTGHMKTLAQEEDPFAKL